ncbi:phytanoyl-CoA dioxygenase family protein [Pseudoalteromonas xiamenensis]
MLNTNDTDIHKNLLLNSYISLNPIYSQDFIEQLNALLTPIFDTQKSPRRYVNSLEFHKLGILNNIFTPELISLLFTFFKDPILYHCHAYEIDANSNLPHIAGENYLDGWHRDVDCLYDLNQGGVQHISFFVYLSDVNADSGPFEVCNKRLNILPSLFRSAFFYRIVGKKGTSFLFDRTSFHRASPNKSSVCRRVLKISFQSRKTQSQKLSPTIPSHNKHFKLLEVRKHLAPDELLLRYLFGEANIKNEDVARQVALLIYDSQKLVIDTKSKFIIKKNMDVLSEFRAYARNLVYVVKLLAIKIRRVVGI